ncbi:2'-5' RNA ligase family protein [Nocardia camponoti]|uniref:2'-5' RNA ligase family protein n=1 Tax=Nocardia camponoti TaxID=1616106 RepID=A0A917Q7P8_9NOCA|nr:2'-5' RNA ligase family protein [Nocardia camponoti]GGK34173.1 hypothetical protein GCM10011591_02340 [Nocardia camponoti]
MSEVTTPSRWWWRPGWTSGRSFYEWQLTPTQPIADKIVEIFAPVLSRISTFEQVDAPRLRIPVQGIGFADAIKGVHLAALVAGARESVRARSTFQLSFGPPVVLADSIRLPVTAPDPILRIRESLTATLLDVWIRERIPDFGEPLKPYLTIAHATDAGSLRAVREALAADDFADFHIDDSISTVAMVELRCVDGRYDWGEVSCADLASEPEPPKPSMVDDLLFGGLPAPGVFNG